MDTTLLKGLRVLEALTFAGSPQSISALSRELGLQKSNVHRTLGTLLEAGFVTKDEETARYSATLKLWEMGSQVISRNFLRRAALPFMRALHQETQETVYLAILDGTDVMYLEKIDAVFPLVQSSQPAQRIPAVRPASGLAILAHHPDSAELVRKIASADAKKTTDPKEIARTLELIRAHGYATTINGWNVGARSVAAAILGRDALPLASIGIAGPADRLQDPTVERYSVLVRNAATRIAELIGSGSAD